MTLAVVVLASGAGTLLQALLDAQSQDSDFRVSALITDQPAAIAISRAATAGIELAVLPVEDFPSRVEWNQALADAVEYFKADLLVSAGFMRIVSEPLITKYAGRFINTHPALLPNFPGAHAVRDALAAGVSETGTTVHFVDAGVDTGAVIEQIAVAVLADDTESTLHERIKHVERELLIKVVREFASKHKVGVS